MIRDLNTSLVCTLLLLVALCGRADAQTATALQVQPTKETELVHKELDEQKAQINELAEIVRRQSDLIERQQSQIEALRQWAVQASARAPAAAGEPAADAPTVDGGPGKVTAPRQAVTSESRRADPAAAPSVESGSGKIKVNGLLQGWYAAGDGGFRDTFRVRRAELKLTGEISPRVKWTLMVDPAKALSVRNTRATVNSESVVSDTSVEQSGRILQDAFITLGPAQGVKVNAGQFKVPLSLEGLQSSAALDTAERALFITDRARGGAYGDVRDLGVTISGPLTSRIDYQLGLFNGSGENHNDADKNDRKAVAGRLVMRPAFLPGVQIGGSGVWGGNGSRPARPRRNRLGAEMLFVRGPLTLKSELMTGADAGLRRRGYYAHFGYRVTPRIEGVFRFDTWDPDTHLTTSAADVAERDYVAGLNYSIIENRVRLQFNYTRKTFEESIVPPRNVAVVNLQTSW